MIKTFGFRRDSQWRKYLYSRGIIWLLNKSILVTNGSTIHLKLLAN